MNDTRRFDAVICDIDGCLCGEDGGPMDLANLKKVRDHNDLAINDGDRPIITLCSGRPVGFAESMARLIGNTRLPVIAEMGVYLFDPTNAQSHLDPAILPEHMAGIAALTEHFYAKLAPTGVTMQPGKSASVTLWHKDTEHLRTQVFPAVKALCEKENWPFRVSMTWFYINCDLTHISKATGIERFKQKSGFSSSRLAGIGDTPSDLAIREQVAFFACPANAHPEAKEAADFVADAPEAKGVVQILEHLMSL